MPCFLTVGRAPLHTCLVKAFRALPKPPPQHNTAPTRGPPQPPTISQPIAGDRDDAGAKYLMRRVLDSVNAAPAVYRDGGSAFHFMLYLSRSA